jgi:tRNA (adenine22-N1)-methyltransferase
MTEGAIEPLAGQVISVSKRLTRLAEMMPAVEQAADIGTDHAKLLTLLIEQGKIRQGLGVEVVEGPWRTAVNHVAAMGLSDVIEIRKGDGLAPLAPGEVQAVIIAGMGGKTMTGILSRSPAVLQSLRWLLLQPMSQAAELRYFLQSSGWRIVREDLIEERGIIYPILLACPGEMPVLGEWEAEYGPLLLAEGSPLLKKLIEKDIQGLQEILKQLAKSKSEESRQREAQILQKCQQMEVLMQ